MRAESCKHMKKIRPGKAGMTLIETIVAFAIIAIIIVAAMAGFRTMANVNMKAQSLNAADESLEALIAKGEADTDNTEPDVNASISFSADGVSDPVEIGGVLRTYIEDGKRLTVFIPNE